MPLKELVGGYEDIKGRYSRTQFLFREVVQDVYVILLVTLFLIARYDLLIALLVLLPFELIFYRLGVIRRLHDLGVPKEQINTVFWQPIFSTKIWWRLLTDKSSGI